MTEAPLTASEYRDLLATALEDAAQTDSRPPTVATLFTPDSHRAALYADTTVVLGDRGVGKTFWCQSLLNAELREIAADEYRISRLRRLRVAPGYGLRFDSERYPGPGILRELIGEGEAPYDIWYTVLLTALGQEELRELPEWRDKVAWARANPGPAQHTIEQADRKAYEENVVHLLLFDALEHMHAERDQVDRLVGGILRLALQMRFGTRNIRLKVFIRPDLFDGGQRLVPDASKLSSSAALLKWSKTDLYGLFFHRLGNDGGELAERFRQVTGGWHTETDGLRHVPAPLLRNDAQDQEAVFEEIADPFMGKGHRTGKPYTWLPNHLMDGNDRISPRSFLQALLTAAETTGTSFPAHERALHHKAIRAGVQEASKRRVMEVSEDTPWVKLAIEPLAGQQVPLSEATVFSIWRDVDLPAKLAQESAHYARADSPADVRTGPRRPDDPPQLIAELGVLGVMTRRRSDDRLDVPDVYRIAFGLGRKGGVPTAT